MNFLAKKMHYQRRKMDVESWEKTIDDIAMRLCPLSERQADDRRQKQLGKHAKSQVIFFPVWRKYRPEAIKVAHIQRAAPFLRHLPIRLSKLIGEVIYK